MAEQLRGLDLPVGVGGNPGTNRNTVGGSVTGGGGTDRAGRLRWLCCQPRQLRCLWPQITSGDTYAYLSPVHLDSEGSQRGFPGLW